MSTNKDPANRARKEENVNKQKIAGNMLTLLAVVEISLGLILGSIWILSDPNPSTDNRTLAYFVLPLAFAAFLSSSGLLVQMILSGKDKKEILEKLEPLDGIKTALVALNKTLTGMNLTMKAMNAKLDKLDAIDAKLDKLDAIDAKLDQLLPDKTDK